MMIVNNKSKTLTMLIIIITPSKQNKNNQTQTYTPYTSKNDFAHLWGGAVHKGALRRHPIFKLPFTVRVIIIIIIIICAPPPIECPSLVLCVVHQGGGGQGISTQQAVICGSGVQWHAYPAAACACWCCCCACHIAFQP